MCYGASPGPSASRVSARLVEIDRCHTYGLLSESSDYGWPLGSGCAHEGVARDPLALGCLDRSLHAFGSLDPQAGSL